MQSVQDDGTQEDGVTADGEHVGEIEREPVRRAGDDERVRYALRPCEQRDEIAECAAARDTGAERCSVRLNSRNENDERGDQRAHQQRHVRRARVMKLRIRARFVQ